eukprot:TRINITY_DN111612_c0_g1_i1.p1 TRINITY_DN111612_c0_g1~~TRINITY_DN111612_c0_g1_i1.p1  ORF type:complete len:421 (-),score=102.30 TRINITY_DN111612_c0_g1_i1:59-1321(-)
MVQPFDEGYKQRLETGDAKARALKVVEDVVEAAPFPVLVDDWEYPEIRACAVNEAFVRHMKCPREVVLGRHTRMLDPTHVTSLPIKVRYGIRAAKMYGHPLNASFESVRTQSQESFMKCLLARTLVLEGYRFIFFTQYTFGVTDTFVNAPPSKWLKMLEEWMADAAAAAGMEARWVSADEAQAWEPVPVGQLEQTECYCHKEHIDGVLIKAISDMDLPVVLCEPTLPDCPAIALSDAAQKLTGWRRPGEEVLLSDATYMKGRCGISQTGTHHFNFGKYLQSEEAERLAVRAAITNGRACAASFRQMEEMPSEESRVSMWMQGVTPGYGVYSGPNSGHDIWYLVVILDDSGSGQTPLQWVHSEDFKTAWKSVQDKIQQSVQRAMSNDAESTPLPKTVAHPYGGEMKLLKTPLWHEQKSDAN